jgi:hypothetical protein
MLLLEEEEETKKKQEPRSVSFLTEMTSENGILKIKDLSFGIFTMEKRLLESHLESFQYPIGQRWMYGNTSKKKK